MKIYLDGALVDEREATASVLDRGLLYGDGLFETLRVRRGRPVLADAHLRRLEHGASELGIPNPLSRAGLGTAIDAVIVENRLEEAGLRVTLTRGPGHGIRPPGLPRPTLFILPTPLPYPAGAYERGIRAILASRPLLPGPVPGVKTLDYLGSILARREAAAAGADDAILCAPDGGPVEATAANLFLVRDGALATPPAGACRLAGITRSTVLDLARLGGMPTREADVGLSDLRAANEAFLTSSVAGIVPVVEIDGRAVGAGAPGPVTRRLSGLLDQLSESQIEIDK
ncbi:MAG: aminotransferase class IV [Methanobacteriota archaeon]